jgi:hypothetical protein
MTNPAGRRTMAGIVVGVALVCTQGQAGAQIVGGAIGVTRTHLAVVMDEAAETPEQRGLLPTALREAAIAAQHAARAVEASGDLATMQHHARAVLHAIDPRLASEGPGLGYGVKPAVAAMAVQLQLAGAADGSAVVLARATAVDAALVQVLAWADEIVLVAQAIAAARTAEAARIHLPQLQALVWALTRGTAESRMAEPGTRPDGGLRHVLYQVQPWWLVLGS